MGYGKWISGALGWALGGPIGGLIGYLIGNVLDNNVNGTSTAFRANKSYSSSEERNSFLVSMLVLSASIMKADGKVMRSELEYVKGFIAKNFGEMAVSQALSVLKDILEKDINLPEVCAQIKLYMVADQRLQLLHFLIGIAQADGYVSKAELNTLKDIAKYLGIAEQDCNSLLAMFNNNLESAYKVLEIEETATDDEVKRAYKKMAIKHHPDKVEALGEDVKRVAEEKFKSVIAAYELIKKERGLN